MVDRRSGRRHWITNVLVAACAIFLAAGCTSSTSPANAPVSSIAVFPNLPGQPAPTQNAAEISASQAANLEEDLPCAVGKATQTIHVFGTVNFTVDVTARIAAHTTGNVAGTTAPVNGEYEVATVQIRVRKGSFDYDASKFQFLNPKGQLFRPAKNGAAAGYGPPLGTGTLQAGQVANGSVTFDVPTGGGGLLITLPGFFRGTCYWATGT